MTKPNRIAPLCSAVAAVLSEPMWIGGSVIANIAAASQSAAWIWIIRFATLALFFTPAPVSSAVAATEPLIFYGDDNSPPYQFLDRGDAKGLNVDLLRAVGQRLERPVEIRLVSPAEAFKQVADGTGHGLLMLTHSPERERVWDFSEPTLDVSFSLFMRIGDLERLRSEPLTEQRIGVQEHTFSESYLRTQNPDIHLEPSRDFVDGLRDLLQGRIDAFAHVTATGAYFLEELRAGGITFAEEPFAIRVAGIAVPRVNSELLGPINEALRDLKSDGTYGRIVGRWTPGRVIVFSEREIWLGAAALGAVVIALLLLIAFSMTLASRRRLLLQEMERRLRAEETVRGSEERLRRVVEGAPFPIMVHAEDDEIIHLSRAWLDLTGYDAGEIASVADWATRAYRGRSREVRADIDRLYTVDSPIEEGDYEVRTADGRVLLWAFRSAPVGRDARGRRLVVSMAADMTERRDTEARLRLLMREVDHRAKNALAVVQAVVQLSRADDPRTYAEAVQGRIAAIAQAHSLLATSSWSGADLRSLVEGRLAGFADGDRIEPVGPPVSVRAEAAQAVSMVLHELATNAAKYGALSRPTARLRVSWAAMPEALLLDWVEKAGTPVTGPPTQKGFGTTLMCNILEKQLHGRLEMDWRAEGLRCRVWLPADTWNLSGVIEAPPGGDKPTAISTMTVKGKRRVLVVEDEALTALALQRVLEDAGFNVLGPVARVQDALDLVGATRPDAAVLDVNLFGETVGPVADVLYKLDVPFLFCTGYHSADNIGDHHARVLVLHKPVNSNDLVTAVGHLFVRGNAGNIQRP